MKTWGIFYRHNIWTDAYADTHLLREQTHLPQYGVFDYVIVLDGFAYLASPTVGVEMPTNGMFMLDALMEAERAGP